MVNLDMNIEQIKNDLKLKLSMAPPLNAVVKFDCGDEGLLIIDGNQNPATISSDNQDADLTLRANLDVFLGLINGTQDPTMAFMMGKLKISGPMPLAMKLGSILED